MHPRAPQHRPFPSVLLALALATAGLAAPAEAQSTRLRGDVDADGAITSVDALAVLSAVVGKPLPAGYRLSAFADADGSGRLSSLDALVILGHTVGKDVSQYPVGGQIALAARVTLDREALSFTALGDTVRLGAAPVDAAGAATPQSELRWTSLDTAVAVVDSLGLVRGRANGTARVVVAVDGVADTARVSVAQVVKTFTAPPASAALHRRGVRLVEARALDANGHPVPDAPLVWGSTDTLVARVYPTGMIQGIAPGRAEVTVTLEGTTHRVAVTVAPAGVITLGSMHTCALATTGQVSCWGSSELGAVGEGGREEVVAVPTIVAGGRRYSELDTGGYFTCALATDGAAYCWGENDVGQLGDGTLSNRRVPTAVLGGLRFQSISAGGGYACALTRERDTYCWGANAGGQLGNGGTANSSVPTLVTGGHKFTRVLAASWGACGIKADGATFCWGFKELPDRTYQVVTAPEPLAGGVRFAHIDGTGGSYCGLSTRAEVYCWGNQHDGRGTVWPEPVRMAGIPRLMSLASSGDTSCGLAETGAVTCWGDNTLGQLGDGTWTSRVSAAPAHFTGNAVSLDSGARSCAMTAADEVYCWGMLGYGLAGNGQTGFALAPAPVSGGPFKSVSAGDYYISCGVKSDDLAYCWGDSMLGSAFLGMRSTVPARMPGAHRFTTFDAGYFSGCGLGFDGKAYCWSSTHLSATPAVVAAPAALREVKVELGDQCALGGDSLVYCWGDNDYGQFGNGGTARSALTPVVGGGGMKYRAITMHYMRTCGITVTDDAYCWGAGPNGELGDGGTASRHSPVAVAGGHKFMSIATGYFHTCGVTLAGATYCWGSNYVGELGSNIGNSAVPVRVPGLPEMASVAAGQQYTCGISKAGAAYCWGRNTSGELGNGQLGPWRVPTPTAVGGGIRFQSLTLASGHACGMSQEGTAYCWGEISFGTTGDGSTNYPNTPLRTSAPVAAAAAPAAVRQAAAPAPAGL
ncbi:MAG: hypothetical protein AVDCRST_MAG68-4210, partial [uncultured Gemmatimonadetes bacterium]